jgi:hypothetical protein
MKHPIYIALDNNVIVTLRIDETQVKTSNFNWKRNISFNA